MEQLALTGVPTPPDVKLTPRQRSALEHIAANQPLASDELGAYLHEIRRERGGKGHPRNSSCDWCKSEGAQMGKALRDKQLVKYRLGEGWILADTDVKQRAADASFGDFPDGF